jgi:hypothetical protein
MQLINDSERHVLLYYQIDYTLKSDAPKPSYLHVSFHRQNPTTLGRDFVITSGLQGPGRFLGCSLGVRVTDAGRWYGEGEVKIYRDGDGDHPTYCGTGLEDYVGSAWGLGPHSALFAGSPLVRPDPGDQPPDSIQPDLVSLYRWHLLDPIMFEETLTVTVQQIGFAAFASADRDARETYEKTHPSVGHGWFEAGDTTFGLVERVDDYCAAAFVYCQTPQAAPAYGRQAACANLDLLAGEASPTLPEDVRDRLNRRAAQRQRAQTPEQKHG